MTMQIAIFDTQPKRVESYIPTIRSAKYEATVFHEPDALIAWLGAEECHLVMMCAPPKEIEALTSLLQAIQLQLPYLLPVFLLVDGMTLREMDAVAECGIDDYALYPVRPKELLFRLQVIMRRAWPEFAESEMVECGRYTLDKQAGQICMDDTWMEMTKKEFALAHLLFSHVNQPVSRATILEVVWETSSEDVDAYFRSVDTHIARIRRKLHLTGKDGWRLSTVYGFGYVLEWENN